MTRNKQNVNISYHFEPVIDEIRTFEKMTKKNLLLVVSAWFTQRVIRKRINKARRDDYILCFLSRMAISLSLKI
jgi:hypothetical protein